MLTHDYKRNLSVITLLAALVACGDDAPRARAPRITTTPAASAPAPGATTAPGANEAKKSHRDVVVALVVDQFPAWLVDERRSAWPTNGGFARLAREGRFYARVRYEHAVTDTAPGHASLFTGVIPSRSGIVTNETCDAKGTRQSILRDESAFLIGHGGGTKRVASSLAALRVDTVADRLRAAHPDAIIVSLSLKDRGTLFGGGRKPTASLWLDIESATWVTSTAVASASAIAEHEHAPFYAWAPKLDLATPWTLLDEAWVKANARGADDAAGEGNFFELGTTFPHVVPNTENRGRAARATPMADAWIVDTATRALAAYVRPQETSPVFIAMSFSAHDYVAHAYGADSWEAWDEERRLDAQLAQWLGVLDRTFGSDGYTLVLSGDHGGIPLPEAKQRDGCDKDAWQRPCVSGPRVDPLALKTRLEKAVSAKLGPGPWILSIPDPFIWFTDKGRDAKVRAKVVAEVQRALAKEAWLLSAVDTLAPVKVGDEEMTRLVSASIAPDTAGAVRTTGDIMLLTKPGAFFENDYTFGKGTNHGTPYLYDRTVPLFIRAPGRIQPGVVVAEPETFRVYARTITDAFGLPPMQ